MTPAAVSPQGVLSNVPWTGVIVAWGGTDIYDPNSEGVMRSASRQPGAIYRSWQPHHGTLLCWAMCGSHRRCCV